MKDYVIQLVVLNEEQFQSILNILCSYDDSIKANDVGCVSRENEKWILIRSKLSLVQLYNLKFVKFVIELPNEAITIRWKRKFDKKDIETTQEVVEDFESIS